MFGIALKMFLFTNVPSENRLLDIINCEAVKTQESYFFLYYAAPLKDCLLSFNLRALIQKVMTYIISLHSENIFEKF